MKYLREISRVIIGLVFIFSGFVKAVDPLGTAYKLTDYFIAFNIPFFAKFSIILSILLCTTELIIGLNLLTKIFVKFTSWLLLCFMSFFTILTFILALTNPVTDCGCFGDAIILTNWQTFFKNLIFLIPTIIVFIERKNFTNKYKNQVQIIILSVYTLFGIIFCIYNLNYLPIFDFRPYKIGTYIPEKMTIPEGAPSDEYKITWIYEKDGIRKEFSTENLPTDTTWKFVDRKQVLIKKGYVPPIHDFSIINEEGEDITDSILKSKNYIFLIVSYNLRKSNINAFKRINEISKDLIKNENIDVYCITASTKNDIAEFKNLIQPVFRIFSADEITLKTIIRSNPGILLLKEGVILYYWPYRTFIKEQFSNKNLIAYSLEKLRKKNYTNLTLSFLLGFLLVIFLIKNLFYKE